MMAAQQACSLAKSGLRNSTPLIRAGLEVVMDTNGNGITRHGRLGHRVELELVE